MDTRTISTSIGFEKAARARNAEHARLRVAARRNGTPCEIVVMYAFGGETYCRAHGVMGQCPYAVAR